jgi:MFS family permease
MGGGSIAGRILIGGLADRVGRRRTFMLTYAAMALAMVLWTFSAGLRSLAVFSLVYGAFSGGFVALLPALVADYFGAGNISSIIGVLYTSVAFGILLGPPAAGFAFDAAHSYTIPILAGACANILAAGIVVMVGKPASGIKSLLLLRRQ